MAFSSVNDDAEDTAIESVSQAVSRTVLAEDSVDDSQTEVSTVDILFGYT